MTTEASDSSNFTDGPLHAALVEALPIFVKEPFSGSPRLNIRELKKAVGKSHETVYNWLRTNRLPGRNARKIVELASGDRNVAILRQMGRTPPKIEDLSRFVCA